MKARRALGSEPFVRRPEGSRVRGLSRGSNIFGVGRSRSIHPGKAGSQGGTGVIETRGKRKRGGSSKKEGFHFEGKSHPSSDDKEELQTTPKPTHSPAPLPSSRPVVTYMPTHSPSSAPTIFPSPEPTPFPSKAIPKPDPRPTLPMPAPTAPRPLTARPTQQSTKPTPYPTESRPPPIPESPGPTQSGPGALSPTVASTICKVDSNGDFGSSFGDRTEVDYLYQMELFPGVTVQEATTEIEKQIVNFLLPILFPEDCAPIQRLQGRSEFDEVRFYTGISASPQDALAAGFECVGLFLEPCFVVRGFMTTWSEGMSTETVVDEVSTAIHGILDSGRVEKQLIDVDKVASLRDPALTAVPMPPNYLPADSSRVTTRKKAPTPPPSLRTYIHHETLQAPTFPAPTLSNPPTAFTMLAPSENSTDNLASSSQAHTLGGDRPLILEMPWYVWLFILFELLILCSLKGALDMYRKHDKGTPEDEYLSRRLRSYS